MEVRPQGTAAGGRERIKKSARLHGGNDGERIAHLTQVVKCFAVNGRNWGLNGCFGGSNGIGAWGANKKKAKSKTAPLEPKGAAPPGSSSRLSLGHPPSPRADGISPLGLSRQSHARLTHVPQNFLGAARQIVARGYLFNAFRT
jgi:hypothetical protein